MKRLYLTGIAAAVALTFAMGASAADKKELAFVVNGASDFWKLAEAGVKKAQAELPNYDLQFKYPEQAAAAIQQRLMDDLVAAGVDAHHGQRGRPEDLDRGLEPHRLAGAAVHHRQRRARLPTASPISASSNTDAGKQAGEIAAEGAAERRQVHGLRRPARRRQRQASASRA